MLTLLWVLLGATCIGMMVTIWLLVRERMTGPQPATILPSDAAPAGLASASGVPAGSRVRDAEIPVDADFVRRSGIGSVTSLAVTCGTLVAIPLIGIRAVAAEGQPVPTWLVLTTSIVGMLAAVVALNALRGVHAFRRLAKQAGALGLRLSPEGIRCSVTTLEGRQRSALVRESRTSHLIPWTDVAGIETEEYRSGGGSAWFLVVRVRSSDVPWLIRCSALSAPLERIAEVVREASAALAAT
jgi:hypothetical protein